MPDFTRGAIHTLGHGLDSSGNLTTIATDGNIQGDSKETFTNGGTIAGIFFVAGTVISVEAIAINTPASVGCVKRSPKSSCLGSNPRVGASFLVGMEPA